MALLFSDSNCGKHWSNNCISRVMNNTGYGLGFGFTSSTCGDVIVDEYFLTEDDGDNFVTESDDYLIIANYSDN